MQRASFVDPVRGRRGWFCSKKGDDTCDFWTGPKALIPKALIPKPFSSALIGHVSCRLLFFPFFPHSWKTCRPLAKTIYTFTTVANANQAQPIPQTLHPHQHTHTQEAFSFATVMR